MKWYTRLLARNQILCRTLLYLLFTYSSYGEPFRVESGDDQLQELIKPQPRSLPQKQLQNLQKLEPLLNIESDEDGYSTTVTQDGFDVQRELRVHDGAEEVISYESHRFGNWFFRYPGYERHVVRIAPGGAMTFYNYDTQNRLETIRDGQAANLATYRYNTAGQLVKATTPDTSFVRTYGRFGRLEKETDRQTGFSLSYTYTAYGLLERMQDHDGHRVQYSYDKQNRVTNVNSSVFGTFQVWYNRHGLPEMISRPNGKNTVFKQDEYRHRDGRIVRGKNEHKRFDAWGQLLQAGRDKAVYDRHGLLRKWKMKKVRCDCFGRLAQVGNLRFAYDWDNRLAAVKGRYQGRWSYDAFGRLYRFKTDREDLRFFFCGEFPVAYMDVEDGSVRSFLFVPGFANCFAWMGERGQKLYPVWDDVGQVLFTQDAQGKSVLLDKRADENGSLGVRSGLSFLCETLLYWNNRFFCPGLNRAMSMLALQPYEPTLHLDNPVSFGDEFPLRSIYRKEGE